MSSSELFQRYPGNPILRAADWPYTVNAVFNPAATHVGAETVLLVRVEDRTGFSHLAVARSSDGLLGWRVEPDQVLLPEIDSEAERYGVEDPRITRMGDEYMIVYTGYSDAGPLVRLATTRDFVSFQRRGTLMTPEDKDAALFPVTFSGQYALIHRPLMSQPGHLAHVWLSRSPDLHFWGDHTILLPARHGGWWDAQKIGLGPPPLLTERGWLVLYHSVRTTVIGLVYRLGLALLEPDRPEQVIARSSEWMFGPDEPYEGTVVFPCGWTLEDDDDTLRMYYGAGDASICVATASLRALLRWLERHSS